MRILGLDVGDVRIGVALSDEMGWTAQPLGVITRSKKKGLKSDLYAIVAYLDEYNVTEIVVGLPLNMNGSEGPMTEKVRKFSEALSKITDIEIKEWDERLSTVAVERVLIEGDVSRKKRKTVVDKLAATYILQGYLDLRASS